MTIFHLNALRHTVKRTIWFADFTWLVFRSHLKIANAIWPNTIVIKITKFSTMQNPSFVDKIPIWQYRQFCQLNLGCYSITVQSGLHGQCFIPLNECVHMHAVALTGLKVRIKDGWKKGLFQEQSIIVMYGLLSRFPLCSSLCFYASSKAV